MDTTNLEKICYYAGIDISKRKLDCWLRPAAEHLCCGNESRGINRSLRWLTAHGCTPDNTVICLENTGIYGRRLLVVLTEAGWPAAVEKTTITEKTISLMPAWLLKTPTDLPISYILPPRLRKP